MQKIYNSFFIFIWLVLSCNNQAKQQKPAASTAAASSIYKMDMLEKMFTNDNWMKANGHDTSYYYFSRNQAVTSVYHYRIVKGDSLNTIISRAHLINDSLVWKFNDTTDLALTAISEKRSAWDRTNTGIPVKSFLVLEKKDDNHIAVKFAGSREFLLTKTLSLSAFLVRSRYDFLHGTRFAFSDTVFSTGKKK